MAYKLFKVIQEFNVGLSSAVETLHSKGFTNVEAKPTTEITNEMYEVLRKEFQKDIDRKNQADKLGRPALKRETINLHEPPARPTLVKKKEPAPAPPPKKEKLPVVVTTPQPEKIKRELPQLKVLGEISLKQGLDKNSKDAGLDTIPTSLTETNTNKTGKNFLLCIGIDDYAHCPRLYNAVKDAKDFKKLLIKRYLFEEGNCESLYNEDATRKNILRKLRNLAEKVTMHDNVIIYFSGHGEFDKVNGMGNWIPQEAERGDFADYLPNSAIKDSLIAIKSHHTFLIVDSCFSGSLFLDKNTKHISDDRREQKPSRWGLTSGRNEIVADGVPGENSPFATKLLKILEENNKSLGVASLCDEVEKLVGANDKQQPIGRDLRIEGNEYGQFFFHLRDNKAETAQRKAQDEEDAFERAKKEYTEDAYDDFIQKYGKTSPHYKDAFQLLHEAEEREAWSLAERKGTRTAYLSFQDHYENGKYADLCQGRLDAIRQKKSDKKGRDEYKEEELQNTPLLPFEPETIRVEGGTFQMGGTPEQDGYVKKDEKPVRNITLSTYAIGKYPVTVGQYLAFCEDTNSNWPEWLEKGNKYHVESGTDDGYKSHGYKRNGAELLPIAGVSWENAVAYCEWLSGRTNKKYRLPTEAEWEYAARGGNISKGFKYSGATWIGDVGWFCNDSNKPNLVGLKSANELGIYDMSGNVFELCFDWFGEYNDSDLDNPQGASNGHKRVARGGAWGLYARYCRVSARYNYPPTLCDLRLGFRLALQ